LLSDKFGAPLNTEAGVAWATTQKLRLVDTITLDFLEAEYPVAAARAKADLEFRDRARRATARLQQGDPLHRAND